MSQDVHLKREIGLFSATAVVVANMVGTGIFTTSGLALREVGSSGALLLCWLLGGVFALCGAFCYGELGTRFPLAGGEYIYLREAFGKPMAFLSGWVSLIVGFSAPIAAGAIAFAVYLLRSLGMESNKVMVIHFAGLPVLNFSLRVAAAITVVLLFSLLHMHSVRMGSRIQNLLTVFKVLLVSVFIGAGFLSSGGTPDNFSGTIPTAPILEGNFAVALIFITFAYSGWNAAAYLGGEIRQPARNIPLALMTGTGLVTLLYLLLNIVYVFALPPEQMAGAMEVGHIAAGRLFGIGIGRWFSAAIAFGLLSLISAMIQAGPRVYYAMARDGLFFAFFEKIDPQRHTPAHAIGLQAVIAVMMIVTAAYDKLLIYIGFTLSLTAMLTVVGLIRLRRNHRGRQDGYHTWGYPITPLVFILGNLGIIVFALKSRPEPSLWGLATIAAGLALYVYFRTFKRSKPTPHVPSGGTPSNGSSDK